MFQVFIFLDVIRLVPVAVMWDMNAFCGSKFWVSENLRTEKNGSVTATKLGATKNFFLLQPKILLQQPFC